MKIKIVLFLVFCLVASAKAFENKILFKIENEIITSFDIYNEIKYLSFLNSEINKLSENQIFEISKRSLLKMKIKKIEITKNGLSFDVNESFNDQLVKSKFSKIGLNTVRDFENKMKSLDISTIDIKEKILINTLWNNLIFKKFENKIQINKNELKKEIMENKTKIKTFFLYEILFNIKDKNELDKKYETITNTIKKSDFQTAAISHSISDTASNGGEIGWIKESSINKNLRDQISLLKINEYSKPILTSAGFLILMVSDKKETENNINFDDELKKLIQTKTNRQFQQYSHIYFNKISKNYTLDEL